MRRSPRCSPSTRRAGRVDMFLLGRSVLVSAAVLWSIAVGAQTPGPQGAQPAATTVDVARVVSQSATVDAAPAILSFQNRQIVTFRATLLFRTPAMRAENARRVLRDLLDQGRLGPAASSARADSWVISVGTLDLFALVPADRDPAGNETLQETAERAAARLQIALDEAVELHTPRLIAKAVGLTLVATIVLLLLLHLLRRGHYTALARISEAADRQLRRLPGGEIMRASRLPVLLHSLVTSLSIGVGLLIVYNWLAFALRRFPYTRPWGEALRGFFTDRLARFGLGILAGIPDLFTVLLIVLATRFATRLAGLVFDAVAEQRVTVPGIYPETAQTTRHLTSALLWLFALALAFPYLPGSDTDAFKGVSVFVGLVISLGSSGIVNQVMSSLTITYSRAIQKGDFVRIGDVVGTVTSLGMLSTKLRTERREEMTIPNAVVISTMIANYSRLEAEGVQVATKISIGYDAPWRQVQELLLLAAGRTAGVRRQPPPVVRQTGLGDFYVEYVLLVCLEDPASKGPVLDALHANIQDAFNEYGVQIMSPHYETDPARPKVVPRDRWFAAPATSSADSAPARRGPLRG